MDAPKDRPEPDEPSQENHEASAPGPRDRTPDPDLEKLLGLAGERRTGRWRSRRRLLLFGGGAAAALAGGYLLFVPSGPEYVYATEPASRADLVATITATGAIEPTNKVDVSSELSGTVRRVLVDFNSPITKGQPLAELDTDKLEAAVDSSRAKLLAAQAKVKEAEATLIEMKVQLDRKEQLVANRIVAVQDRDIAVAAHKRAEAALESVKADVVAAEADLKLSNTNLAKACICSPIDGVVLTRSVEPGQTVAASLSAPVLFTIAEDLRSIELQVDVDEADVGRVRDGQKARFTVDAYPGAKFTAEIRKVHFGSEIVQNVVTYKAVLTTDNSDMRLRPGMTATAEIVVDEMKDALTVPNAALRFTPPGEQRSGGRRYRGGVLGRLLSGPRRRRPDGERRPSGPRRTVWTLVDGEPQAIRVSTGATDGSRTAILKGAVEPGMALIVDAEAPGG